MLFPPSLQRNMKTWIVTCVILFILVEVYQSVKGFILPLPIYVLAGAFLAIASNYNKGIDELFERQTTTLIDTATLELENPSPTVQFSQEDSLDKDI